MIQQADIAIIAETKTKKTPKIEGYTWYHKPRKTRNGGGIGILILNEYYQNTKLLECETHEDHELIWLKINTGGKPTFLGAYYGPQEKTEKDCVYREYQEIGSTILRLKQQGEVILLGDFNAKLEVNTPTVTQKESRNGELLQTMLNNNNLDVPSINQETAQWTRINRNKESEKSIIDYVITTNMITGKISCIEVCSDDSLTLKGKKKSDHTTITLTVKATMNKQKNKVTKLWAPGNRDQWTSFNEAMCRTDHEIHKDYNRLEKEVIENLKTHTGKITIRGSGRRKETEKVKELRRVKREKRKQLQQTMATKTVQAKTNVATAMTNYKKAQNELKAEITRDITIQTKHKMEMLVNEGGVKSNNFWKIRKRLLKSNDDLEKYTQDEQGNEIKDPDQIKQHIADYYEDLYQARDQIKGYEEATKHIIEKIDELRATTENDHLAPFTLKELEKAIAKLKRNKATGPDDIPNSAFIEANRNTRTLYLKTFNHITKTKQIPPQWQHGEIIRLYKGKGPKGKCSNERGITLSSNMGKLYKRLLNTRILSQIKITEEQAGGRKGSATIDHILRTKELIRLNKLNKKTTYITILDVTKAYDKAWLDAIMYTMDKQGCNGAIWNLTDKLNQNLTATIRTSIGQTRTIKINNSIRQGGVLAVTQYAALMDEINKEIQKAKQLKESTINPNSTCLLWVDDVAIITDNIN